MPDVSLSTEGVWEERRANIRGSVGRRVRQPADVDDIVQRVFLQVHRRIADASRCPIGSGLDLSDDPSSYRRLLPRAIAYAKSARGGGGRSRSADR
jgi:hypothetical protein